MYKEFSTKKYYGDVEGNFTRRIFGLSAEWHYFPDRIIRDDEENTQFAMPKEFMIDFNFPFSWLRINVRKRHEGW